MFQCLSELSRRGLTRIEQYPIISFFVLLALLFGIIGVSFVLRTPEVISPENTSEAKVSPLFVPETDPAFITVPAKAKKETIVNVVALAPGIVSTLLVTPGRAVTSGQTLLVLTNDYQGGSAELSKSLASENARLTLELAKIDKDITALKEKQTKRDSSLSNTEEDIALAELEKDRATRKSSLSQSALSLQLSTQSDAVLKPKTFVSGIVTSLRVKRGDLVTAGQVLATIMSPKGATTLEVLLDADNARFFAPHSEARLQIGDETITLLPTYFAASENENGLYSILFALSPEMASKVINGDYLRIELPLASSDSLLIPIDALYQDEAKATVLVLENDIATPRTVTLGTLHGSYAEIKSGLSPADQVLLSRSVIAGDRVTPR
jgi:multidrug efflux pump subunit AcrA (membrane-fusion protein)